jgi:hypothetical protein
MSLLYPLYKPKIPPRGILSWVAILWRGFCPLQNFTHEGDYVHPWRGLCPDIQKYMKGILSEGDYVRTPCWSFVLLTGGNSRDLIDSNMNYRSLLAPKTHNLHWNLIWFKYNFHLFIILDKVWNILQINLTIKQ